MRIIWLIRLSIFSLLFTVFLLPAASQEELQEIPEEIHNSVSGVWFYGTREAPVRWSPVQRDFSWGPGLSDARAIHGIEIDLGTQTPYFRYRHKTFTVTRAEQVEEDRIRLFMQNLTRGVLDNRVQDVRIVSNTEILLLPTSTEGRPDVANGRVFRFHGPGVEPPSQEEEEAGEEGETNSEETQSAQENEAQESETSENGETNSPAIQGDTD
ncbi:MAG: hypothetical protein ACLFR1_08645 [Spirochaetia bacterium]